MTPATHLTLDVQGRFDKLPDLRRDLGAEAPADDAPLTDWVLAGWRRWGEQLPEHLLGDFAIILHDAARGSVFLARDPLGVKPLYYTIQHGRLYPAFSVAALRKMPGLTLTPDPDWMARYLLRLSKSDTRTGYREVFKLPPGHCLTWSSAGEPIIRRYHHWRDDARFRLAGVASGAGLVHSAPGQFRSIGKCDSQAHHRHRAAKHLEKIALAGLTVTCEPGCRLRFR